MRKGFLTTNFILIAAVLIGDLCYYFIGTILLKGIVSFGFVLLGIINLLYCVKSKISSLKYPLLMVIGAIFAMIGDVLLGPQFVLGAASFAIGHVFFFSGYCTLSRFRVRELIPTIMIFIPPFLLMTLAPFFDYGSFFMEMLCITYAVIICFMVGKAIANFMKYKKLIYGLILAGSILFYTSDLMLLLHVFGGAPEITDILCIATYYPAQCLLAHSIFYTKDTLASDQVADYSTSNTQIVDYSISKKKIS